MLKQQVISDAITLFRSGKPFPTGAAVASPSADDWEIESEYRFFAVVRSSSEVILTHKLEETDCIYGLGQSLGGLNKRGRCYRIFNTQDIPHTPEKKSLNSSTPFILCTGRQNFGVFVDYPSELIFDVGFSQIDQLVITIPSSDFDLYIIEEKSPLEIARKFLQLIGQPFVPPKWAFGYQQSRFSYPDEKTIRQIASEFRERDIPCDAIYMDIDYMEDYKTFTVDKKKFPDLSALTKDLQEQGFKLVPIIDPGVKIEEGYSVYEEGCTDGYFCKDSIGKDYEAAVWPGLTHLPDFFQKSCQNWWGSLYRTFTEAGIHAFWNDMNEPQIYYSSDGLRAGEDLAAGLSSRTLIGSESHELRNKFVDCFFSERYYRDFFHKTEDSREAICHFDIHNLYSLKMVQASAQGLQRLLPDQRYFLLTRSAYVGSHRYSGFWTGDNCSWWEHMLVHMRMMQSLGLSGTFYCGSDIGGHIGAASAELTIRWMQLGAFTPLFRNHSDQKAPRREPWMFDDRTNSILRDVIRLRYAFLPYAYSEYLNSIHTLTPFVKPLFLCFELEENQLCEDQYMYGRSLMVTPVHSPNSRGRFVHLPQDRWLHWAASDPTPHNLSVWEPGDYFVPADLSEIPLWIRENNLIVLGQVKQFIGDTPLTEITIIGLVTDTVEYTLFEDDGFKCKFDAVDLDSITVRVRANGSHFKYDVQAQSNRGVLTKNLTVHFKIYDAEGRQHLKTLKISI